MSANVKCKQRHRLIVGLLSGVLAFLATYSLLTCFLGNRREAFANTINLSVALATAAAAWGAFRAAQSAAETVNEQKEQDQVTLWRSLSEEFDYKMSSFRHACGMEFKGVRFLLDTYVPVMDFFETVAYLVRHNRLPELAKHTFWHYFDAYYRATGDLLTTDNLATEDKTIYEDCIWLHNHWGPDTSLDKYKALDEFFDEELRRNKP